MQQSTISHIETGVRKPSLDLLFKLAELFDVSLDDLMQIQKAG